MTGELSREEASEEAITKYAAAIGRGAQCVAVMTARSIEAQWTARRRPLRLLWPTAFGTCWPQGFLNPSVSPEAHVYKASGLIPETCERRFEFDVTYKI